MLQQNEIKRKSANDRLEFYYYLGQTLAHRGWSKKDSKLIQQLLEERTHRELKRLAKRTFELFSARGIGIVMNLTYMKPTHLAQMTEDDFYDRLLPEARRLRQMGLISE